MRRKLHKAFQELESMGFFAPRKAWQCCQSCGCAALPEGCNAYVFYHEQDLEYSRTSRHLHLAWGTDPAHGHQIAAVLRNHKVRYSWNGELDQRIRVDF